MKTSLFFLIQMLALPIASSFAPPAHPPKMLMHTSSALASSAEDEVYSTTIRKRDRVKNAVKNVLGMNKEEIVDEESDELPPVPSTGRKYQKAKDGKKYEKIECLEEKAYQILKDLDMIDGHK